MTPAATRGLTFGGVPSDEELRRVAEDVRALARSLARDLREAGMAAHRNGRPAADALRQSLRDAAEDARREFGMGRSRRRPRGCYGYGFGPWPGWGGGRTGGRPFPSSPGRGPGTPAGPPPGTGPVPPAGPGPGAPPWAGRSRHQRQIRSLPPVRRRWDAPLLFGLLAVAFGTAGLIGGLGLVHLSVEAVLAVGLMLLGAALVVAGRTDWSLSRHSWPVVLGVVLVVGLFATSSTFGVAGALPHMSVGTVQATPTAGRTVYGGVGELDVNLANVVPGGVVHVASVAGETIIQGRPGVPMTVSAHILAGRICLAGTGVDVGGIGQSVPPTLVGAAGNVRPIVVDVHQTTGEIVVGARGCGHP